MAYEKWSFRIHRRFNPDPHAVTETVVVATTTTLSCAQGSYTDEINYTLRGWRYGYTILYIYILNISMHVERRVVLYTCSWLKKIFPNENGVFRRIRWDWDGLTNSRRRCRGFHNFYPFNEDKSLLGSIRVYLTSDVLIRHVRKLTNLLVLFSPTYRFVYWKSLSAECYLFWKLYNSKRYDRKAADSILLVILCELNYETSAMHQYVLH